MKILVTDRPDLDDIWEYEAERSHTFDIPASDLSLAIVLFQEQDSFGGRSF